MIPWKTYNLQLLTHTFISGADQRRGEIRVPSIRGQLRWWFRALGGEPDQERSLFGGIHSQALRSSLRLRLVHPVTSTEAVNLPQLFPPRGGSPQGYLLWPLRPTQESDQRRGLLRAGTKFQLQAAVTDSDEEHAKIWPLLHLWMLIGSLGTRSRRGYGSIGPSPKNSGLPFPCNTRDQWTRAVRDLLGQFPRARLRIMCSGRPRETPDDALNHLADWLRDYRAGSTKSAPRPQRWGRNDHDVVLAGREEPLYRPVIGLPLTQRYKSRKTVDTKPSRGERWASPIHLRVVAWREGYQPLAIFLPEMAMREGEMVLLVEKRQRKRWKTTVSRQLFEEMMKPETKDAVIWDSTS